VSDGNGNEEGDDDGDGDNGGRGWKAMKRALATAARAMAAAQREMTQQPACAIRQQESGAVRGRRGQQDNETTRGRDDETTR